MLNTYILNTIKCINPARLSQHVILGPLLRDAIINDYLCMQPGNELTELNGAPSHGSHSASTSQHITVTLRTSPGIREPF